MNIKLSRRFVFCLYLVLTGLRSFSQDVIILKNGDEIQSKVMEVSTDIVKYKKWNNQDGPIYSSNKTDVFMIKYQNGTKDVFNATQTQINLRPNDNSSKIIEIANPFMSNQISSESKGACKLVEFNKQNGVEKDIFGQKIYTLEYRLTIELQKDCWKESEDRLLAANWYWRNFSVLNKRGDELFLNYAYFTKGTTIEITGAIDFENTDNGWRITGADIFSHGYKNKTSRILSIVNNDKPVKPELNKSNTSADVIKGNYVGDYKDGKKSGHGKMTYEDGSSYEGEWKDDKKEGEGTSIGAYGSSKYFGSYKDGKESGHGKICYNDSTSYEGEWNEGKENGLGTYVFANKKKLVGNFVDGKTNGKCILYNASGDKEYEGEYKNGKRNGYGTMTIKATDGTKISYMGEWREGKKNGQGNTTLLLRDGITVVFIGEYKEGDFFNGTRTKIEPNGTKYICLYTNGKEGKEK